MDRPGALTFYDAALSQYHLAFGTPIPNDHGTTEAQSAVSGDCSIRKRDSRRESPSEGRDSGSKFTRSAVSTTTSYAIDAPNNGYSTELNSVDSPLLRLPAEIRGMIFTYIFSGEEYLFHGHDGNTLTCGRSFTELNMSFLLVSRQAHAETALLPYNHGTICFRLDEDQPDRLVTDSIETFLEKRSVEQIKAIASLETCVTYLGYPRHRTVNTGTFWAQRLGFWQLRQKLTGRI